MSTSVRLSVALAALCVAGCAAKSTERSYLGSQPVDLHELTPAEVAREVDIVPRGNQVFFQAPTIQSTKLINMHRAGEEMGLSLGTAQRVRFGYLFGVLDRGSGTMQHYVLFQSNFVVGSDRYAAVTLSDGQPLHFTVSRVPDPCVPNCFPVIDALIVQIPGDALRAAARAGLGLSVSLDDGTTITVTGPAAYVQGYLDAVDGYTRS